MNNQTANPFPPADLLDLMPGTHVGIELDSGEIKVGGFVKYGIIEYAPGTRFHIDKDGSRQPMIAEDSIVLSTPDGLLFDFPFEEAVSAFYPPLGWRP